jgi:hypothetical protein
LYHYGASTSSTQYEFFLDSNQCEFFLLFNQNCFEQFPLNCKAPLIKEFESLSTFLELERLLIAKMIHNWHEITACFRLGLGLGHFVPE